MAQAIYTRDDLLKRRIEIARWVCAQTKKIAAYYCYGQPVCKDFLFNYQYVIATLEAIECYTPLTTVSEDGVINCLTEEKLTNIFSNFTYISGIDFLPKGYTYNPNNYEKPLNDQCNLNSGGEIDLNSTPTQADLDINPILQTGTVQQNSSPIDPVSVG